MATRTRTRLSSAPDVLHPSDVASILGLSVQTVRAMCNRGDIPARKAMGGNVWLIPKAALEEWLRGGGC